MLVCVGVSLATLLGACAGSDDTATPAEPESTGPATSVAPVPEVSLAPDAVARTERSMRGQRYCEVLLVDVVDGSGVAEVFNSWPLNDCPDAEWRALDGPAIATASGASLALLNGPRYWLMNSIEKADRSQMTTETFGGIEMIRQATVDIGPVASAAVPYQPRPVDRRAAFVFDAGEKVFELTAPDGRRFVMQTWSQMVDPALVEPDLAGLGSRLQLPAGWTYSSRVLEDDLVLDTTGGVAQVLQDDLRNSYSLVPS